MFGCRVDASVTRRAIRLVIHQIDRGEIGSDLRAAKAFEPLIDLVLQQLRGLLQQSAFTSRPASKRTMRSPFGPTGVWSLNS
ncbi:MAG: hypothetical protein R3C16_08710 [Hyphomonadaceae bacterium]